MHNYFAPGKINQEIATKPIKINEKGSIADMGKYGSVPLTREMLS